jgi:adenylosuccinate synthase
MGTVVIVGTQWGDEGKGKITDFMSRGAKIVARYQGGDNAGHTIHANGQVYKLQLVPSGILYEDQLSVIGNGVVANPKSLLGELGRLHEQGVSGDNLRISDRAQVILPYHILLDKLQEAAKGDGKIGTTGHGIGPAYMDKAGRVGIRFADLLEKDTFAAKLKANLDEKNVLLTKVYDHEPLDFDQIFDEYYAYGQQLAKYVGDTSVVLNDALDAGENVLFEGAQGIMLDVDQGTYPFVTSSNPAGGVSTGSGVGASRIDRVVGVVKAYTSRVGDGPFPTEQLNETGDFIRNAGHEFGTVTGRPRRIGWFDAVVVNHAKRVAGVTDLCINSIDVLTGLDTLRICTAYKKSNGEIITRFPASLKELADCTPVYEDMPGWTEDITGAKTLADLPEAARNYTKRLAELIGVDLLTFSVGPDRDQTNVLEDIWAK